jgi:50S ribosomal protein L16 3-hydroxylase
MPQRLVILDALPSPKAFYATYWNQKPFLVRAAFDEDDLAGLISADELAGLAMEDAPLSRMVMSAGDVLDWSAHFGPFSEDDYTSAGDKDWSLLVQNVEQFHPDTSALLRHFKFAPRWLMDDIMVSYSTPGGSVGPHIDSYHVFLVQGQGRRMWTIGREVLHNPQHVEGLNFKLLKTSYEGDRVEVSCGDVLYLPPNFAHEGTTIETSLTYSVGFLGPKLSELLSSYGHHLAQFEETDPRYVGDGLNVESADFTIAPDAVATVRKRLGGLLNRDDFSQWLVTFFTESGHEDFGVYSEREDPLSPSDFAAYLKDGDGLIKPYYVKFALTSDAGVFTLGFDGHSFVLDEHAFDIIQALMKEQPVNGANTRALLTSPTSVQLLCALYNHEALEFC